MEYYEALMSSVPEGKVLLFMDAVQPAQMTTITSVWIRKDDNKVISTMVRLLRLSIVGAIAPGNLSVAIFYQLKTTNRRVMIVF
ncbi:MAG: hypothetical protein QS748_11645 [Candidatus Endonucleobacter bathymodioli]|uniref:Uncharacterized protein n=1 Tax=Candidatus Endonucleibacter bathymodioli TaxID=539814 RepID=A0AA90SDX2_9GAMM|nr:hypothetical protein [Candidatus Endonucleobacter bathymodioli]